MDYVSDLFSSSVIYVKISDLFDSLIEPNHSPIDYFSIRLQRGKVYKKVCNIKK